MESAESPPKFFQDPLDLFEAEIRPFHLFENLAGDVLGIGLQAETADQTVFLFFCGQKFGQLGRIPQAQRKHTGGNRIEGPGMANLALPCGTADQIDHIMGGQSFGLIYVQDPALHDSPNHPAPG